MIIHLIEGLVGDNLWDQGVGWANSGIVLASGKRGVLNVMEIAVTLTSIGDIWSSLQFGGLDHFTGAGDAAAGINN